MQPVSITYDNTTYNLLKCSIIICKTLFVFVIHSNTKVTSRILLEHLVRLLLFLYTVLASLCYPNVYPKSIWNTPSQGKLPITGNPVKGSLAKHILISRTNYWYYFSILLNVFSTNYPSAESVHVLKMIAAMWRIMH